MPLILIDGFNTSNPFTNAATEEYIVRQVDTSEHDYLFLYRNAPCIVVGKNQNIYKEINFEFLRNDQLTIVRRISGGGTVYHDLGNLNFAFITRFEDWKVNNYRHFNQPIVAALNKVNIPAEFNTRNDIIVGTKKLSGNAQFTNRKNIISHGTLLYDADLPTLRACLKKNDFEVQSKSVASVSSSVINLKEVTSQFDSIESLNQYLVQELNAKETKQFDELERAAINHLAESKYQSFDWIYGRNQDTWITKTRGSDEIKCQITASILTEILTPSDLKELEQLVGTRYLYKDIKKRLDEVSPSRCEEFLNLIF